jgi:hypothetical protein
MKTSLWFSLAGVALLTWCGVKLAIGLGMSMGLQLSLVGFAFGIMFLVTGPMIVLRNRVKRLEDELAGRSPGRSD